MLLQWKHNARAYFKNRIQNRVHRERKAMRKILFRGKSVDNGEWVYGDLMHNAHRNKRASILCVPRVIGFPGQIYNVPIIKDTICQFTELHDSDGKDIYEGDILIEEAFGFHLKMVWFDGCFKLHGKGDNLPDVIPAYNRLQLGNLKIVGNIHDNPELINEQ